MQFRSTIPFAVALLALGSSFPASAMLPDEGMWPFDSLPLKELKEKYGFEPTAEWLDHVRLGSVRFDTGGSGSFVSPNGLVMTNHHVALETIQKVSTPEKDWVKPGFSARLYGEEVPGKDLTIRQLVKVEDVTEQTMKVKADGGDVQAHLKALCDERTDEAKHLDADEVVLYDGNQFKIYTYHVYDDVRLVFAPAKQVAFYGGRPRQLHLPAVVPGLRVLPRLRGRQAGRFVEVVLPVRDRRRQEGRPRVRVGPPGRHRALADLRRDGDAPRDLGAADRRSADAPCRGTEAACMEQDEKRAFELRDTYFGMTNSLKAYTGHLNGLLDDEWMARIKARDEELIEKSGKPEVKAAFDQIAEQMAEAAREARRRRCQLRQPAQRRRCGIRSERRRTRSRPSTRRASTSTGMPTTPTRRSRCVSPTAPSRATRPARPRSRRRRPSTASTSATRRSTTNTRSTCRSSGSTPRASSIWTRRTTSSCTCDIIGGNSGSPILDRDAKVVGLVFDGNIESLPGNYWFDAEVNRCVGVHAAIMIEALVKVYEEYGLVSELMGN